jgi:hypothetical protein
MIHFQRFTSFAVLIVLLAVIPPASAQISPWINIISVTYPACTPGEYPRITFEYEVPIDWFGITLEWQLTNQRSGLFSTAPGSPSAGYNLMTDYPIPTAVPTGTQGGDTLILHVDMVGIEGVLYDSDEVSWTCGGEEEAVEPEPIPEPGCDTMVYLPPWAVVGTFNQTIQAFWAPGKLTTNPPVVIEGGKTAWVLGVDETGGYYKFLWACQFLWAPVGTLGPNFDEVWRGRPLPGGPVHSDSSSSGQSSPSIGSTVPTSFPVYGAPVDAETYTVQAGDNLFRIALYFGVDLYRLAAVNGIQDPNHILVGQVLDIAAAR